MEGSEGLDKLLEDLFSQFDQLSPEQQKIYRERMQSIAENSADVLPQTRTIAGSVGSRTEGDALTLDQALADYDPLDPKGSMERWKEHIRQVPPDQLYSFLENAMWRDGPDRLRSISADVDVKRQNSTISFLDLSGFTAMCGKLMELTDRNDYAARLIWRLDSELTEVVKKYGGKVDKYEGDALMSYWEQDELGSVNAVRAGLEMQERLQKLQENQAMLVEELGDEFYKQHEEALHDLEIRMRVGVNYGEVLELWVGQPGVKMDLTLLGTHVNQAARHEAHAKPNTVEINESVYQRVKNQFEWHEFEPGVFFDVVPAGTMKGIDYDQHVYRPVRYLGMTERQGMLTQQFKRERLIGREKEVQDLEQFVEGNQQRWLISADPGAGKSMLVSNAIMHRDRYQITGQKTDAHEAFKGITDLLRGYLLLNHDPPELIREKIDQTFITLGIDESRKKFLASMFGVSYEDDPIFIEGEALIEEQKNAATALLQAGVEKQQFVVVVDDIQWMDEQTIDFLDHLYNATSISQLHLQRLGHDVQFQYNRALQLSPLTDEDCLRIAQNLAKQHRELRTQLEESDEAREKFESLMMDWIAKTQHNPFYIKARVGQLANVDLLSEEQVHRLSGEISDVIVSHALSGAMREETDRTLMAAATLGMEFDKHVLDELIRRDSGYVLADLMNRSIVDHVHEDTYSFSHGLVQETFEHRVGEKGTKPSMKAKSH